MRSTPVPELGTAGIARKSWRYSIQSGPSQGTGTASTLAGVLVFVAALARRNAALQRQAEQAASAERARIARELHDIVAHHLSVMVLQAAGTRASGKSADAAVEKIENSGR